MKKRKEENHKTKDDYPWRCLCGKPGFVDLGEDEKKNRFPCQKCYAEMKLKH